MNLRRISLLVLSHSKTALNSLVSSLMPFMIIIKTMRPPLSLSSSSLKSIHFQIVTDRRWFMLENKMWKCRRFYLRKEFWSKLDIGTWFLIKLETSCMMFSLKTLQPIVLSKVERILRSTYQFKVMIQIISSEYRKQALDYSQEAATS